MNIAVPTTSSAGSRPRTKTECYCMDHASALPPLTQAQKNWARMKPEGIIYHEGSGRNRKTYLWCQHCGCVEEISVPLLYEKVCCGSTMTCGHCGATLTVKRGVPATTEHNTTFGIINVYDGWQVVRWFNWRITVCRNEQPRDCIEEVLQLWVDMERNKLCLLHKPYYNNFYRFQWIHGKDWKVKKRPAIAIHANAYTYYPVFDLTRVAYYPHCQTLPILKRNGWKDSMTSSDANILDLWRALYADPIAEQLAKWQQYEMLYYYVNHNPESIRRHIHAVRVCSRHGYTVSDANIWLDYIALMDYFRLDTHNPKLVAPADLTAAHDVLMKRKQRIDAKKRHAELIAQACRREDHYKKYRGAFFGIQFENDNIRVHVISSVKEMAEEGEALHHCVYTASYYDHRYHPRSLILSARDHDGRRLETVEVDIESWSIAQSRSAFNQPSAYHDEIVSLVNSNIPMIRQQSFLNEKNILANITEKAL